MQKCVLRQLHTYKSHSAENERIGGHYGVQKGKSEDWKYSK